MVQPGLAPTQPVPGTPGRTSSAAVFRRRDRLDLRIAIPVIAVLAVLCWSALIEIALLV